MKRILVAGKNGQIGWELLRTLMTLGEVVAVDRTAMDLADADSIRHTIREIKPNIIVNGAAYTAVEKAESEPELAMAINGVAPGIMAEEAKRLRALIIHYSTDYVFDGTKKEPYTEDDKPNPLNVYGKSKLAGEQAIRQVEASHLIFRTSWIYATRGKNFLLTILRLAKERSELRIVGDQTGVPTWSRVVAEVTAQVVAQLYRPFVDRTSDSHYGLKGGSSPLFIDTQFNDSFSRFERENGIFHVVASGKTTWHGFASLVAKVLRDRQRESMFRANTITPVVSKDYPQLAERPANSVLDNGKLATHFGLKLPSWEHCVDVCLDELMAANE